MFPARGGGGGPSTHVAGAIGTGVGDGPSPARTVAATAEGERLRGWYDSVPHDKDVDGRPSPTVTVSCRPTDKPRAGSSNISRAMRAVRSVSCDARRAMRAVRCAPCDARRAMRAVRCPGKAFGSRSARRQSSDRRSPHRGNAAEAKGRLRAAAHRARLPAAAPQRYPSPLRNPARQVRKQHGPADRPLRRCGPLRSIRVHLWPSVFICVPLPFPSHTYTDARGTA